MENRLVVELVVIFVIVLANSFFALAEFSVVASRKSKLKQMIRERKAGAASAERLRNNTDTFLAAIQLGITLTGAILGVFSGATIVEKLETMLRDLPYEIINQHTTSIAMFIVIISITSLSVVIGELAPKYIALSSPEKFASVVSRPVTIFVRVTSLFSRLLGGTASLIVRMMGIKRRSIDETISEEEINQILLDGREKGQFEETEQKFIRSVFEFTDSTVRRAMTPRTDVIALDNNMSEDNVLEIMKKHGFSRYPVYDGTIDNVTGIVYVKDFITRSVLIGNRKVSEMMRKPNFVPDSFPLPRLLSAFRTGKGHMAIVLDEFGGTAGIITLEDILEELVGEIQDEYDVEALPVVRHSDTIVYANGSVWPGEINRVLGCNLPKDISETLAGLFMDAVGRLPEINESLRISDVNLTIIERDKNRIIRLKLEKIISPAKGDNI